MPQGRRKVPFSGKAKKLQMKAKKQRQTRVLLGKTCNHVDVEQEQQQDVKDSQSTFAKVQKLNQQPRAGNSTGNKYTLQFLQESKEELMKRKEEARRTINPIPLLAQEISDNFFPPEIDMPKRPEWDFNTTKEILEARERKYFAEYLKNIEKVNGLSYFELNLETWRQLWRVLEMSDILLIIVDIRYPVLTFPPYLYTYVTKDLGKNMILVLNKIDLAPAALVVAWREYFKTRYPKLHVLMFTSFPTYNLRDPNRDEKGLKSRRLKGKLKMAAEGAQKLLDTCEQIVGDEVDLSSWRDKIREEMESEQSLDELNRNESIVRLDKHDTDFYCHERYKNGILTIGCIGTPNVGKSSLMNALMGRKVVSVSRTPGHTKHFQTIFLTTTVRLCDCPGLVFPSTVPKQLQILMGSFPIAQVKEPYTTVKFLAERLDLPRVLNIHHQEGNSTWSAMDICDGWAAKRSYLTARTARFDCYRSANSILRMALDGKICIYAYPIGWSVDKDKWEKHPDIQMVQWIQARGQVNDCTSNTTMVSTSDEEESYEQVSSAEEGSSVSLDEEHKPDQICNSPISHTSSEDESDLPMVANRFTALTTAK
ncbi:guanine nucleotide-binding protein-like 1 isoform X1 [Neodiprion virginianus]|uniref:guanine nucleotide-binding protein-like 1 isoform X1 n=2 Tax=Neodiprion virginianus TaxID=2961670 RepID=UPI001EE6D9D2|nr:guanine nucleotide-binding protein-like 1 isoform X1 [Neodiprion virginianus]